MRHWLQLATRNWRAKPGRTAAILVAVALGVGAVITVTSIYASVEATIGEQIVDNWLGKSHLSIESPHGHWGSVDQAVAPLVAELDGVAAVTVRFKTRMHLRQPDGAGDLPANGEDRVAVDVVGIDPGVEYAFRGFDRVVGRRIGSDDRDVIVLEQRLADELGLAVGDVAHVEAYLDDAPRAVEVVGLLPARRVAIFQKPTVYMHLADVQGLRREKNKVSVIDAIVTDAEPAFIEARAEEVRELLRARRQGYIVTTATGKLNQLLEAQRATRIILLLFSFVALLTAFFIILTTMSMGMMERVRLLGALRCVGMTRLQLAALVYAEVVPLGIFGVLLGLPVGFLLTRLGVAYVPHVESFVQEIVWSLWGVGVGVVGGLATTVAGATAVLWQGAWVSPMQAVNSQAQGDRKSVIVLAAVVGAGMLVGHAAMIDRVEPAQWFNPVVAFLGTATLYGGYMLLAPAMVLLVGATVLNLVAPLFGIRRRLAQDQIGRSPWRSAGVCWTLMVGLSLIVYFFVRGESVTRAWDFPARLAGTFVWTPSPISQQLRGEVEAVPGVGDLTPINDVICKIQPKQASILSMLKSQSVFAAGDPDTFLSMAKLDFLQGDYEDARSKLERGGYILLPPEASHSFGYHLGDKVPVTVAGKTVEFEVAGVVRSPAMDIAVSYFQADSYMMLASASSVLGTLDDLRRHFGIDTMSMFLMNVDTTETPSPPEFSSDAFPPVSQRWVAERLDDWLPALPFEQEHMGAYRAGWRAWLATEDTRPQEWAVWRELSRYNRVLRGLEAQWGELAPAARWEIFREGLVLENVKQVIKRPDAMTGSLRRLKQDIDDDIRKATLIVSSIPVISLLVASIGVANLMMVNINSRARQIATLRAVGSTKGQIARLVLLEAFVLGLLGSGVGVVLGLHTALATNELVMNLIGFEIPWVVPWPRVAGAVLLTWSICLAAGIGPALRAARSNIVSAFQTA